MDPASEQSWIERQVTTAINSWLSGLTAGVLQPLAQVAGAAIDPRHWLGIAQVQQLWQHTAAIANSIYALLVLVGAVLVMTHNTLQTRYAVKEIVPRVVFGWVAANLSWTVVTSITTFAVALAAALAGDQATPGQVLTRLLVAQFTDGPIFLVLLALIVSVLTVALVLGLIVTLALLLVLVIAAPLALCCHALPQTEAIAWGWWRTLVAALSVPVIDGLILALLGRVMLTPGDFGAFFLPGFTSTAGTLLHLLVVLALLWLLLRVPRWVFRIATGRPARTGGRGIVRTVVRNAIVYGALQATGIGPALGAVGAAAKTASKSRAAGALLGSLLGGRTGTGRNAAGKAAAGKAAAGKAARPDPYQRARVTPDGQYLLPLPGVRHGTRRLAGSGPANPAQRGASAAYHRASGKRPGTTGRAGGSGTGKRAYRGRQLALPLTEGWPEHRPVLGRDGQYRLPLNTPRARPEQRHTNTDIPPASSAGTPLSRRPDRRARGTQQALWTRAELTGNAPGPKPRIGRDGQYRLPIEAQRVPKPTPPPPAPAPRRTRQRAGGRQTRLPDTTLARPRTPKPPPAKPTPPTKPAKPEGGPS